MITMMTTPTTTVTMRETQQTTVLLISQLINGTISTQIRCRRFTKSVTSFSRDAVELPTMASLSSACTAETARRTSSDRVGFTWSYGLHRRRCLRWTCGCGGCCRWFRCGCLTGGRSTMMSCVVQREMAYRVKGSPISHGLSDTHITTRRSNPCKDCQCATVTSSVRATATSATRLSHPATSPALSLHSNTHTGICARRSARTTPLADDVTLPASFLVSSCR